MDFKTEIGTRLRAAREAKGLTCREVSELTGDVLDLKRINAYENGSRLPTPTEITILSKALGKRAAYLMGLEDETEEQLLRNWRTLNERERMDIFRKVEAMAATSRDPVQDQVVARHLGTPRRPAAPRARRPG